MTTTTATNTNDTYTYENIEISNSTEDIVTPTPEKSEYKSMQSSFYSVFKLVIPKISFKFLIKLSLGVLFLCVVYFIDTNRQVCVFLGKTSRHLVHTLCGRDYLPSLLEWYEGSLVEVDNVYKKNGFGELNMRVVGFNIPIYKGEWKDNLKHGKGVYHLPDGSVYVGSFESDHFQGEGKLLLPNRDVWRGHFFDGHITHGKLSLFGIGSYEGPPSMTGKGVLKYLDGSIYSGDFRDGLRHGKGVFTRINRSHKNESSINSNSYAVRQQNYDDIFDYFDERDLCDIYDGFYKNDEAHGNGNCTFFDGRSYYGPFKNGKKHGKGRFTFADNDVYEGYFEDDVRHGYGTHYVSDGTVCTGIFVRGIFSGQTSCSYSNNDTFVGDFEDITFDNNHNEKYKRKSGTYTLANGDVYTGTFKDNKFSVVDGLYIYSNGLVYSGEFKEGKKHGRGVFYHNSKHKTQMLIEFNEDEPIGENKAKFVELLVLPKEQM